MIRKFLEFEPRIHESVFLAENSVIIGQVNIKKDASIWYNVVIRGDVNSIAIGEGSNIQDQTMLHVADNYSLTIGDFVTVGHQAIVHGCTIGNNCLIGMGAIILDGAEIGDNVIIGAGSLITQGKKIPNNSLVIGSPGKVIRELTDEEIQKIKASSEIYIKLSKQY